MVSGVSRGVDLDTHLGRTNLLSIKVSLTTSCMLRDSPQSQVCTQAPHLNVDS